MTMPGSCKLSTLIFFGGGGVRGFLFISCPVSVYAGPGSSVGIATVYGLHGPGSNPGGDEIFRPSRPALEPTQPPVK